MGEPPNVQAIIDRVWRDALAAVKAAFQAALATDGSVNPAVLVAEVMERGPPSEAAVLQAMGFEPVAIYRTREIASEPGQWASIADAVWKAATQARGDPLWAVREGIKPDRRNDDEPSEAAWLRGAANHLVPRAYRWEVTQTIGGCHLTLTGFTDVAETTAR